MTADRVQLRNFQQRFFETVLNRIEAGERVTVANVHPGSGKTLAALHTANHLFRMGRIDTMQVLVPRINLCRQFETDWRKARADYYLPPTMNDISWRENITPLIRDNDFGYVTTYASLMADTKSIHLNHTKRNRSLLVLDEAQQLGADENGGTRSAAIVEELGAYAEHILVLSGTPYRSDGKPLLFAHYSDPDEYGVRKLQANVSATYLQGVSEGYLRPFEYRFAEGHAIYEYLDGGIEELRLTEMKGNLYKVLELPKVWHRLVDMTIEQVRQNQELIDPRLCGLIGAYRQEHARDILKYIERKHKGIKALIAISDDNGAQDSLVQFRMGGYDILITVRMAYVGYDHKPISVVLALSDFREWGFLDQFFARGMRMMDDIPTEQQTLIAFVPDDPKMAAYVEAKRKESEQGLKERGTGKGGGGNGQPRLGLATESELEGLRAQGIYEEGDLTREQVPVVAAMQEKYQVHGPLTGLARLIRDSGGTISAPTAPPPPVTKRPDLRTNREIKKEWSKKLHEEGISYDKMLRDAGFPWEFGFTAAEIKKAFGGEGVERCGIEEVKARLRWLDEVWRPHVLKRTGRYEV